MNMQPQIETKLKLRQMDGTELDVTEQDIRAKVRGGALIFEQMGLEGDVKKIWDPRNTEEVADAKRSFEELTAKGFKAYRTNEKGDQGEQMTTFDEKAGRVILVPRMVGG